MTDRGREYTRAKRKKAWERAKQIARGIAFTKTKENIERIAQSIEKNRKVCSCPMCCNPRRSPWNKPKQKLTKHEQQRKEDLSKPLEGNFGDEGNHTQG